MPDARDPVIGDARRLDALRRTGLLDSAAEDPFDRLTRLAAGALRAPVALVSLVAEDRQFFKSNVGLPEPWRSRRGTTLGYSFCKYVVASGRPVAVANAAEDPVVRDNPAVKELGIAAYLGIPLTVSGGEALGSFCVIDTSPREWTSAEVGILRDLAACVTTEIELRLADFERRRSEERLRLLESVVLHANDAILITEAGPIDPPGPRIVFVNDAFTRLTGFRAEDVIGHTPRVLQGPRTDRRALDLLREAMTSRRPARVEVINYRKDGSEFWTDMSLVPVTDAEGRHTHWVSIRRDVTDKKRVEAELLQAKEAAEAANQAKSTFLSRMSHELRTPLNAILGFSQLLEMGELDADQRENLAHIRKAGCHLLHLINEVLDIARVEAGTLATSIEAVHVGQALQEALALVQPLAAQAKVGLVPPAEGGQMVMADLQRLKQVLLNLLSNAVKYNRPGGTVTVGCQAAAGSRLRILVTDTGPGIAEEDVPRLFVPFQRLGAEQRGVEGVGLGLAISRRLLEAMNGSIGVESTPGEGSTFWLELPLTREAGEDPPAAPEPGPEATVRGTVLYVEDNLAVLKLVQRILARRPGVRVLPAMQGRVGLDLARQHLPDLILLDFHLADVRGDELLRWIWEDPRLRDIPVVFLTGGATPNQKRRLLSAGARYCLNKPIDVGEFLRVVDELLAIKGH